MSHDAAALRLARSAMVPRQLAARPANHQPPYSTVEPLPFCHGCNGVYIVAIMDAFPVDQSGSKIRARCQSIAIGHRNDFRISELAVHGCVCNGDVHAFSTTCMGRDDCVS